MKKNIFNVILLALTLVSCGDNTNTNSNTSTSSESITISSESVSEETSSVAINKLDALINNKAATKVEESYKVYKNNNTIYEKESVYTYDDFNKLEYVTRKITGVSSLDEVYSSKKETSTIYYDGDYSYILDSDNIYLKQECKKEIKPYTIPYDLTKLTNVTYEEDIGGDYLKGIITSSKAASFLNTSLKDLSDVSFKSVYYKENWYSYELTYTSGEFSIDHYVLLGYEDNLIELPASNKIKTK